MKPAVWIDANIHATEITGTTTALGIAYTLLNGAEYDPSLRQLLERTVYYIVPRVNPDGAALALASSPAYIRSGVRAYPYEEKEAGLHEQDIDGDGRILQMRIPDPNGDWKCHPEFPNLMIKREPDEYGGAYYRIFKEGLLEDFDGYQIKIPAAYQRLDFNRNFPFDWKPESDQLGAGPYPGSENEIRALMEFILAHPNINLALTYHTFSRAILRPFSTKPDADMDNADLWTFQKIGEIGERETGYRCVSTYHDFLYNPKDVTTGAFDDWMYDHLGVFTYTVELWDLPDAAGINQRKFIEWFRKHPLEDDIKIYQFVKENSGNDGYVGWYKYQHPQLGQVELGGWNSFFTWRNPPQNQLEAEVTRNIPFALALGNLLPHLEIAQLSATQVGPDTYHINLIIDNPGYLPTYTSQQGKKRKALRPVRVQLELPDGAILIDGELKLDAGHLEGRSNKIRLTAMGANSPTDNRTRAQWVVKAPSGIELKFSINSDRAGSIYRTLLLP
jgi:murein tripeptide amidase MpaA